MRYMYYETISQLDKRAAAYNDMLEEESTNDSSYV